MMEKYKYEIKRKDKIEVEAEIDYSKLQINYKKLGDVIARAIIEADRFSKEEAKEKYKNTKLPLIYKIERYICLGFAISSFVFFFCFFVCSIFNIVQLNILQVSSLLLLGLLLMFIAKIINIMGKSDDSALILTLCSLIIALATFVVSVWSMCFGG